MTAKEYLNEIRTLGSIIEQKRRELDTLHELATSIGSFDYGRDRVQTSAPADAPFARTAERAAQLDSEISELSRQRLERISLIHSLDNNSHIQVLYKLYVEGKRYEKIAVEMDYSYDRVRHIHYEALDAIETKVSPS